VRAAAALPDPLPPLEETPQVQPQARALSDQPALLSVRRAEITAAHLELQAIEAAFRSLGWGAAYGSSGTVRAIGVAARALGFGENGITGASLQRLRDLVLDAGHVRRLKLPGVNAERAPVFPGGLVILHAAFEALGIERLEVAEGALREGVLYDLLGRMSSRDVRTRTIQALTARYHVDGAQAERVEHTVRRLLEQARTDWKLSDAEADALGWAARLHEIGLAIAHTKYHRHGAYLLEHSDLPGFSLQEQRMLAVLVRAHRRRYPVELLEGLPRPERRDLRRACVLLRLAVLLNRGRANVALPDVKLSVQKKSVRLGFPRGWLRRHPLTRADLGLEAEYLRAAGVRLEYA